HRLLVADVVVVPDELLRDRRAAGEGAAAVCQVVVGRAQDTGRGNASLAPEVAVLGGQHRVLDGLRDLAEGQDLPMGGAERADRGGAVAVVDRGVLLQDAGRKRGRDLGPVVRVVVGADQQQNKDDEHRADDAKRLLPGPAPPPAALDLAPAPPAGAAGTAGTATVAAGAPGAGRTAGTAGTHSALAVGPGSGGPAPRTRTAGPGPAEGRRAA